MEDREKVSLTRLLIKEGNAKRVMELIGSDKSWLNKQTPFGTWLHVAARAGKIEIMKVLIDSGINIEAKGGILECSALSCAASDGQIDAVKLLLSHGATIDTTEPNLNPLFGAIYNGHIEVVKILLEYGVDVDVKYTGENMKGVNALAFAKQYDRHDIVNLLKRYTSKDIPSGASAPSNDPIYRHISSCLGEPLLFGVHEIVGDLSIYVVPESATQPFKTLVTSGISKKKIKNGDYAEVLIYLPKTWPVDANALKDQRYNWPIQWMRQIHQFVKDGNVFVNENTFGSHEKIAPSTNFTSIMLLQSPGKIGRLVDRKRKIDFYEMIPLYEEERLFKSENGTRALLELFVKNQIATVVDVKRNNVAKNYGKRRSKTGAGGGRKT